MSNIYRVTPDGTASTWLHDVSSLGGVNPSACGNLVFGPLGANGIAFRNGNFFVQNTTLGMVVTIPVQPDGSAGAPAVFAGPTCDLWGADGQAFDNAGNYYVAVNIPNKIVRFDPRGNMTTVAAGSPPFFFPTAIAFGTTPGTQNTMFITNATLVLPAATPGIVMMNVPVPDIYLAIGGSVGVFKTDTRIFNPSNSKDISITASLLPVGNVDNTSASSKAITVPKRTMVIYDDVASSLFGTTGLGAIRLTSSDDFIASSRIRASVSGGTNGQFVPGMHIAQALTKGVITQLKSSSVFRTNVGLVNPNPTTTSVTLKLFDRNSKLVAQTVISMPPFGVIGPTNIAATFPAAATADVSDAWVSWESSQGIFAYGSVIDNGTTDPTFVPGAEDTGS